MIYLFFLFSNNIRIIFINSEPLALPVEESYDFNLSIKSRSAGVPCCFSYYLKSSKICVLSAVCSSFSLMTRAGIPATTVLGATSCVTTAPAATTEETAPVAVETVEEAPGATTTYEAPAAESNTVATSTVSGSEAEAKEWIAQKESGGSYTATNGRYIGRYQLTDSYLNGDYSAENQERVADAYVAGRYGSWTAAKNFWVNNGWY